MNDSRALFAAGKRAVAENALFAGNVNKRGTGAWSLESGTKLMFLAASFANRHDYANARAAAAEALQYLDDADKKLVGEGKLSSAARGQEVVGTLNECILHNEGAALQAYRKALGYNPNSPGAANGNARLGKGAKG